MIFKNQTSQLILAKLFLANVSFVAGKSGCVLAKLEANLANGEFAP